MARDALQRGPNTERVRENVKEVRRARGLQLDDVSRLLTEAGWPIGVTTLSKIESGQRRVDVDDVVALAVVLGVTPNRLLLQAKADDTKLALTPRVNVWARKAWAWAVGEQPLDTDADGQSPLQPGDQFRNENRPHDARADATAVGELVENIGRFAPLMREYRTQRNEGTPHLTILRYLELAHALYEQDHFWDQFATVDGHADDQEVEHHDEH